jgi:hypothetical protein
MCEECKTIQQFDVLHYREPTDNNIMLCIKCQETLVFYSKTECLKKFLLSETEIEKIRYLYFENPKNIIKLYKKKDIDLIISNKYSDVKLDDVLEQKKIKQSERINKINLSMLERKKNLENTFEENKLDFKNYGDCYSYIHYGYPSIENIMNNEFKKVQIKNKRRITLANRLEELKIPLDESHIECYNFIHNIGLKPINEVVRTIEIDNFLKTQTNFNNLLKINGNNIEHAREIALREYMDKDKKTLPTKLKNNINKNITVDFDL